MSDTWTTLKLIQWTTGYFEKAGIPNPRLDAELLLTHVLKCKRIDLYTRHEDRLQEKHLAEFKTLIQRRLKREPLQYILGETEFYGLTFKVTPDVLIPRPETELLVEEALKVLQETPDSERAFDGSDSLRPAKRSERSDKRSSDEGVGGRAVSSPAIMDIGTGSGCIAITLAKNLTNAKVVATDISKEALEIARHNARCHEVEAQIEFILADIAPWRLFKTEARQFDLIISNPPYIRSADFPHLQTEVRSFEPKTALESGLDGLDCIRQILQESPCFLKPGGEILLEIGEDQEREVQQLAQTQKELDVIGIKKDLNNLPRILRARRVTSG